MPEIPEPGSLEHAVHKAQTENLAERLQRTLSEAQKRARELYRHNPSALSDEFLTALQKSRDEVRKLQAEGIERIYGGHTQNRQDG